MENHEVSGPARQGSMTFGALLAGRHNNLDALRVVLALMVLMFHSYLFSNRSGDSPLTRLSGGTIDMGTEAVGGFFAISGILITASWLRKPAAGSFLKRRILRIHPGFIAVTAFCLIVVGYIGANDRGTYFSQLNPLESLTNALLLNKIEGQPVFDGLTVQNQLNGSLWTIKIEFECYLLVLALGLLGLFRRRSVLLAGLGAALLATFVVHTPSLVSRLPLTEVMVRLSSHFTFGAFFLAGSVVYLYKDELVRSRWIAIGALVVWLGGAMLRQPWILGPLALTYLIAYVGYTPTARFRNFAARGDVSYGIYLYGWPVQLLVAYFIGQELHPLVFMAFCIGPTVLCAALSWRFIERPALSLKNQEFGLRSSPSSIVSAESHHPLDSAQEGAES